MLKISIDILGWVGSVCLILGYWLSSKGHLSAQSFTYQILNLVGSVCLIINSTYYHAYPSSFVNIVWAFVAISSLRHKKPLSEVESP